MEYCPYFDYTARRAGSPVAYTTRRPRSLSCKAPAIIVTTRPTLPAAYPGTIFTFLVEQAPITIIGGTL